MVNFYDKKGNYIGDQLDSSPTKKAKKPGPINRLKKWNQGGEDGRLDRLGSLSKIAAALGGDGLDGVSPSATPVGEGAPGSIQYTKLDQEIDAKQEKIRDKIRRLS